MSFYRSRPWTPDEDAILMQRVASGEFQVDIAKSFPGRSEKSVLTRVGRLRGSDNQNLDRRKARNSSAKLSRAINDLIERMDPQTLSRCLGAPLEAVPGTERIFKTSSAERLAA